MDQQMYNHFLDVDTVENAVDSLEIAVDFLKKESTLKWKWVAFAIHHSLYMFCISALELGNYENVLSSGRDDEKRFCRIGSDTKWKKSKRRIVKGGPAYLIEWEDTDEKPPEKNKTKKRTEKLIGFWTALARVQDQYFCMGRRLHIKAVSLTDNEWDNVIWLTNEIRNGLVHFVPKLLFVPIEDIKHACLDFLRIIEFLCFESNAVYIRDNLEKRIRIAIESFKDI